MNSQHLAYNACSTLCNVCCKFTLLNSHDVGGTQERVVSQKGIVCLLHRILHVQQALFAKDLPVNGGIDEEETYKTLIAYTNNSEELSVVNICETVGMDNGSPSYGVLDKACWNLHHTMALSKEIISVTKSM